MISWFEKHSKISWAITLLIAIAIFYISSLTFELSTGVGGIGLKATLYHIIAFFFFSFFLAISLVRGKNRSLIFLAIIFSVLYSISDEIHQFFVPGRVSSISDVFLDSVGIIFASLFYFILLEYRKINLKNTSANLFKPALHIY